MLDRFGMDEIFKGLAKTVGLIKSKVKDAIINLAFADVAATDFMLLAKCINYAVEDLSIDILNLPDTSGSMAPNQYQDFIKKIAKMLKGKASQIAVHCHNDMGMASANTVMGVIAGAKVIEVAALGIGERNGIGDLYSVCKQLKDQGYNMNVRTDDLDVFKAYYGFVNEICIDKLGEGPLNYNTPIFGESVKTHVAGTHGIIQYSNAVEKNYYLNVLCGKHLVKQYLNLHQIPYDRHQMKEIVRAIKNKSVELNRGLTKDEVKAVLSYY
jgi:2-isopropylmalate synthase